MNLPRVSIGIPVHNGEKFLKKALISIIYQSHKNIEIIISNNCSTDSSLEIIKKFENIDNRIILHNQKVKLSMMDNFRFVLNKSNSNYFMWAACDDIRSRNFKKKNLEFLESNKDFVASILRKLVITHLMIKIYIKELIKALNLMQIQGSIHYLDQNN